MRRLLLVVLKVLLAPLSGACALERWLGRGEHVFAACGELLALAPGWPGSMLRHAFYSSTLTACADRAHIGFGTLIVHRGATIGRDVYIGRYGIIGTARIGDGAKIASRVSILSGRHQHHPAGGEAGMTVPSFSPIAIGARCWIGERAVVMASVGAAAVVGAGSVVVRDVPDGVTVAGNPARLIAASWMKTGKPAASKAASNVAAVR
jgi:acetyltransferase-like isoleucine patch superfamily enzyme